jgi:DNA-binding winged helix-turn-helix (wHTH) protein/Tfp pilus assembly protein PilF
MAPKSPSAVVFGAYLFDVENRLTRAGRPVPLPPKESAVLRLLTERGGRAVSKSELFERVWPGVAPSDESLTRCIYALRQALNDPRKPHRFIETVHGRGYRFVGEVRPAADRKRSSRWLERASDASPRVYEAFLHARSLWHRGSSDDLRRAVVILKQALDWNPRYAAAHSALGACYTMMLWQGLGRPRDSSPQITAAATRALELDPAIAGAKATLAYVRSAIDWRPAEADDLFDDAIASDSTSSLARYLRAVHLVGQGRVEEAVESSAAAVALDPFSLALITGLAYSLYASRRFQNALESARRAIELDPSHGPAYGQLALALDQLGQPDDALAAARRWVELSPDAPGARGGLAHALARRGQRAEAAATLERARVEASARYVVPSTYAVAACALGDGDGAFAWLDLAVEQRCCFLGPILADPRLDPIRDDARYRRLATMVCGPAAREAPRPAYRITATERRAAR